MIELKDISATYVCKDVHIDSATKDLLVKNNFKTSMSVQDVVDLMKEHSDMNWDVVLRKINYIQNLVNKANFIGMKPISYATTGYEDKSLEYVDRMNKGDVLMRSDPTNVSALSNYRLEFYTIEQLKKLLSYTNTNGKNYFDTHITKLGTSSDVLNWIDMYEKQVQRQAKLTSDRTINLFDYQQDEKEAIVKRKLRDIVIYLVCYANEKLVWGEVDYDKKKLLLDSVLGISQKNKEIRDNIIYYIANYTTLPELQQIAENNPKVLKRFIVK